MNDQQKTSHEEAARLLAALDPNEAIRLLSESRDKHLTEEEGKKPHPLRKNILPDEEFAALVDHLLDGGGSANHHRIRTEMHDALVQRNQAAFWPLLAHHIKSCLVAHGHVQPLAGGGVKHNGVARPVPPIG